MQDLERKSLWRLNELEGAIKKKVNENFVTDSLKTIETKFKKEITGIVAPNNDKYFSMFNELKT